MPLRKLHRAGRGLLWIIGTPDSSAQCMNCRDHLARVRIMRHQPRWLGLLDRVSPTPSSVRDLLDGARRTKPSLRSARMISSRSIPWRSFRTNSSKDDVNRQEAK